MPKRQRAGDADDSNDRVGGETGSKSRKLASFSIAKYGAQTGNDWQWFPDAGNGVRTNGQNVTGNDPNDANVPSNSTFQQGWVQHLVSRWGTNRQRRLALLHSRQRTEHLALDPSRRPSHRRDDGRDQEQDDRLRRQDQSGGSFGAGRRTGRMGLERIHSAAATISNTAVCTAGAHCPIATTHGGADYLPWLLDQLRQNNIATGKRLLDILRCTTTRRAASSATMCRAAMQLRRNRSTRSLWDPNYVDETWINDRVRLIPRLQSWVNTYYPGTLIGITEYNWGAENHINGATTQADILASSAAKVGHGGRWTTPATTTPTYKAMKMYRNYDGNKSTFGEPASPRPRPNPDTVSAFAAAALG